jgi:hypothetical protein
MINYEDASWLRIRGLGILWLGVRLRSDDGDQCCENEEQQFKLRKKKSNQNIECG